MASPVGEDNWVGFVDSKLREAADLDARVNIVESFRRAVSAEPGSIKVWTAYCEYFWSLHIDCQPGSDAGWSQEEQQLGRELFSLDAALALWQQAYEAVQHRLADSHELWNRWMSLEMELLARCVTETGIRRITQLFKNRLAVPHATWDATSQMFSTFLSEYNQAAYESEMQAATHNARDAKRIYDMRDPFEMKLKLAARSGDAEASKAAMLEYLDWEIKLARGKRDAVVNFQICLGLFSRALTGELASDEDTWLNFVVFISTARSELKAGHSRIPASLLPNMLDVLQRAVHHVPWSGTVWARYILAAEEAGLNFTDIERIKHAATNSSQLDRDGMTGVLEMYAAWCGYLKRTAMNPNATEEAVDIAEVGLPSAIEDVKHWGKRRYGDSYQGDPNFRLEKILIQFLTEKKDNIEAARHAWESLAAIDLYANSYDFWLNWFLWEMVVFTASKNRTRSPTPATLAHGLRVPSYATRVFQRALKVRTLDWPERIMEVFIQHCNDYELADTLREAQDTVYKTRKGVAKRREREAAQAAAAQAEYAAQYQDQAMADAPDANTDSGASPSSKRKREESPGAEDDKAGKRAKSEAPNGVETKRDRENTSVFVAGLPSDATQTKVRQFFREYGHVNQIEIQRLEDSAVALVEFKTPDEARSALLRDGKSFGENTVQVTSATDCTLYVTNYPPEADDAYIRKLFKGCGEIHSIRFPSLKYNTRRRFCYLTFRDRASAAAAIKLDGRPLEGGKFKLSAKLSDPGMRQQRHGAQAEARELHVTYLPRQITDDEVRQLFVRTGKVVSVRIPRDMAGRTQGSAFVVMETREEAQEAIETLDKVVFANHVLKVELSKPLNQKLTATSHGAGSAGSPEGESPAAAASPSSAPGSSKPTHAEISARTIAVLGIPDTMNDARVRAILAPIGTIVKLVLHPKHGGAIVEFADAATAGKAALVIDNMEVDGGKKLRVGTVPELFRTEGETRVDRIDKPAAETQDKEKKKPSAAELMPPPPNVRRMPLGRAGPKRGLGFVAAKKDKEGVNGASGPPAGAGKSNAEFRKMFLGGGGGGEKKEEAKEQKAEETKG